MDDRITGVMVYYYFVCRRKLWYFCHDINMENENENVMIGRILDETSYKRDDKHVNIDNVINIDFIREHKEIHEIKKSKAIEEAGIWQTKYYLYYLKQRGVNQLKAKIDYPLLRKNIVVELSAEDEEKMRGVLDDILCYNRWWKRCLYGFSSMGIGESEMKVKVFNCRPVIMQKVQGVDRGKNADRIRQLEIMKFKRLRNTDVYFLGRQK